MSWVHVTNVTIKNPNPAPLNVDFAFEVSFSCLRDLSSPLNWRLVYVGCADDKSKDQEIEAIEIGPIKKGSLKFTFESDPPDFAQIHPDDVWGTTVILLEGSYLQQDFIRIGWYLHNYYVDPILQDDPPDIPDLDKMARFIVADEPRVTRFNINWSGEQDLGTMSDENLPASVRGGQGGGGEEQEDQRDAMLCALKARDRDNPMMVVEPPLPPLPAAVAAAPVNEPPAAAM